MKNSSQMQQCRIAEYPLTTEAALQNLHDSGVITELKVELWRGGIVYANNFAAEWNGLLGVCCRFVFQAEAIGSKEEGTSQ